MSEVYDWINDPRVAHHWRARGAQVSPAQFQESLATDSLANFVGVRHVTLEPVAYALLFSLDLRAQHCQIGLLSKPSYLRTGLAIELGALVMQFAFDTYPLRKIYLELPGFNVEPLQRLLDGFAVLEATIPEHVYWAGDLYPTLMYSIRRESWLGPMASVRERICRVEH